MLQQPPSMCSNFKHPARWKSPRWARFPHGMFCCIVALPSCNVLRSPKHQSQRQPMEAAAGSNPPIRSLLPCSARAQSPNSLLTRSRSSHRSAPGNMGTMGCFGLPGACHWPSDQLLCELPLLGRLSSDGSSKRPMKLPACVTRSSSLPHCCPAW